MNKPYIKKFKEHFQKVLFFNGYTIYDDEHSVGRYKERVGKEMFLYEKVLKKSINWIIANKKQNVEDRYIFCSKRYGFGIQVHWRKDRYTDQFGGYSSTTLSKDEMKFFTKADKQIFVEQLEKESNQNNIDYFLTIGYANYKFKEELQNEMDICGFDMYVLKGDIHYTFDLIQFE